MSLVSSLRASGGAGVGGGSVGGGAGGCDVPSVWTMIVFGRESVILLARVSTVRTLNQRDRSA